MVSSVLHLCRPREPPLYEVGKKEKDMFEMKTKLEKKFKKKGVLVFAEECSPQC